MKKKVEIVIRIDGAESFYVLPETHDPPGLQDICHGLDAEVDAVIRTTTNIQKTEWNIIRVLVAMSCHRVKGDNSVLEVLIDEDNQIAIRNVLTGKILKL